MNTQLASNEPAYVRPDVALSPLINQYYAWLHLVSPATAAMNYTKMIGPLLRSFIATPAVHRSSSLDPRLRGGMFVNHDESAIPMITKLADHIEEPSGPIAALAAAIDELAILLEAEAAGADLTPCYARIPPPLRGYVELVYDLNDHARVRFSERLLYNSASFREADHCVDLARCTSDERPFAMSTPRLPGPSHVQAAMPLRDERIGALFATLTTPRPYGELVDMFEVGREDSAKFADMFSADPRLNLEREVTDDGVRARYFGHACVVVQTRGITVVTDPFISDRAARGRYSHADLPDTLDYVVITHGHQDHLELGTLLKLRHKIGTVIVPKTTSGALQDPSLKLCLEALGFQRVVDVEPGDTVDIDGGRIVACPFIGEHCDLDIGAKVTYAVSLRGRTLYFGADTRGLDADLFAHIREMVGEVDAVFLGMECDGAPLQWLYGPLFSRRVDRKLSRTRKLNGSNAREAIGIVRAMRAPAAYVYAMGREPWLGFVMATSYTDDSYQLKQVKEFLDVCARDGVAGNELLGQAEFRFTARTGSQA